MNKSTTYLTPEEFERLNTQIINGLLLYDTGFTGVKTGFKSLVDGLSDRKYSKVLNEVTDARSIFTQGISGLERDLKKKPINQRLEQQKKLNEFYEGVATHLRTALDLFKNIG